LVERFDLLIFEDLNIAAMKRLWGRKVCDLGFSNFLLKTSWMCRKLDKEFVKIGRWEPTTKPCNKCGHKQDMPLNKRIFVCEACGYTDCRDGNAALNILQTGRGLRPRDECKTPSWAIVAGHEFNHSVLSIAQSPALYGGECVK
jgi:putative transposase